MPDARTIVVLDIDGTLLHSVAAHQTSLIDAFAQLGVGIGDRELTDFPDHTDSAIYARLLAESRGESASAAELEQLDAVLERHYVRRTRTRAPVAVVGARTLLARLAGDDRVRVAFATGSMRRVAQHKLAQLGVDLDGAILATASDRLTREEIVAHAIDLAAGAAPVAAPALSIGDGLWDLRTAVALGLPFLAVESGTHRFDTGPVHTVTNLSQLTVEDLISLAGVTSVSLSAATT